MASQRTRLDIIRFKGDIWGKGVDTMVGSMLKNTWEREGEIFS